MEMKTNHDQFFLDYLHRVRNQIPTHIHEHIHLLFHINQYYYHTFVPTNYYEGDTNPERDVDHRSVRRPKVANLPGFQSGFASDIITKHICKKNLRDMPPLETPIKEPTVPKKITIECTITTLKDLLDIIEKYPLLPDTEYNIDLKALHNIKVELHEINEMIGLNTFKDNLLDQLLYFIQHLHINREHDFKHMVIYGPPGSGKTQVAKLIGSMYAKLGILKNGIFRKVTRNDLVAGFLGQTAIKTTKVIQECLGGCLFIDEVYSLGSGGGNSSGDGDSFSKECIDTLCEALSNYKEDLMVIVAGYEHDVNEFFFKMNSGLPSRFIWRFTVEEYSAKELMQIFLQKVEINGWNFTHAAELSSWFENHRKDFAYYGRDIEMLFTYTKVAHGRRIYGKSTEIRKYLTLQDLNKGHEYFLKHSDHSSLSTGKLADSCFGLYL